MSVPICDQPPVFHRSMETWQSNHILFRQWVVDAKVFLKKLQHFGAHLQTIPIVQSTLRSIPFWQLNLKKFS